MMWWILWLTLTSSVWMIKAQETAPSPEEFKSMLVEAAIQVYEQHKDEMSRPIPPPPPFDMPENFMRSFVPDTGVGNREELVIDSIKPVTVFDEENFTRFRYKRFNNTDYVAGIGKRNVVLNQVDGIQEDYFVFSRDESIFTYVADHLSVVTDVVLFTRFVKYSEYLYVAILVENARTSFVTVYEIVGNKGVLMTVSDLNINPSLGSSSAKKIAYVNSQYGSSLVILIESVGDPQLLYRQKGSSELNRYIALYYPSAIDLVTFTVHGHGYMAVTNHTSCEVYKMDEFARAHLLFDRLPAIKGKFAAVEYFRLGFHHYLALSGEHVQQLYIWKKGEFSLKQELSVPNVKQIYASVLSTCRDDVILLLIQEQGVDFYVFSGRSENFVRSAVDTSSEFKIQPKSITSFAYKNQVYLLLTDGVSFKVFIITTSLEPVPDPVLSAGREVSRQMNEIKKILENQSKEIKRAKGILAQAVRSTGDQRIIAFQSFDNIKASNGIAVNQIMEPIFVEWQGSNLTVEEYKKGAKQLEEDIEALEKLVGEIERKLPDVVRVDEEAVVSGQKKFTGGITGSSITAVSVNLQSVAGIDLPKVQKELYRLDKPQQINGTLVFDSLTVTGSLDVDGTINGIDIGEEVMTIDTEQTSTALMQFQNKLIVDGNLDITGKLNNIKIKDEVVTLTGNHVITGKKTFLNGIIADDVQAILVDGVDINDLYARAFTIRGKQNVPGTKHFSGQLITQNIILEGTLNGYKIEELANSIVRIDKPAIITGHKTFLDDVTIDGNLTVGGTMNGLRIPDDLFLTDKPQVVTGTKIFSGNVTAYKVTVDGTIDGLKVPDDIVTLSKDEEIPGTLFFTDGINVAKDIIVEGLVDGVDISELASEALKLNETSEFKNAVFLGPVNITGNLDVEGTINKVDIRKLVKDVVFKDEKSIVINSKKKIKKMVADTVKLESMINGFNIEVDFMKVKGDQVIDGTVTFKQPVTFNSIYVEDGMIGGLNISTLYQNAITLAIEDEVEYDVEFVDHLTVEGDLIINGTLNGLKIPDDLVLKNSKQPIRNKIFSKVKVDNIIVDGDVNAGLFGGVNLTQFYKDRVTLASNQVITGDVWIGNSSATSMQISGLVNGKDLNKFAENVMSKTKNQTVIAAKEFKGNVIVHGPITTKGVNGVNLTEIDRRAFKLTGENIVTAPMEFADTLILKELTVAGHINGVNLTRLDQDSLKKTGLQHVTGVTTFTSGFHVEGNIIADSINGMVLQTDVLLKTVPQNITGSFTIGDLGIAGDLNVTGLINGLDLSEVAPLLARTDKETVIESSITFTEPIRVFKDIEVTGLVNEIDLRQLRDKILRKTGDQVIKGKKVFRGNITILGDIDVGSVNGIHWKSFLDDIVRIDVPQKISARKILAMDTTVRNDVIVTGEANVGLVNGKNLQRFMSKAVYIDTPANITGPIVFANPVEINGDMQAELINGLRLKTDVITIMCNDEGPQIITGQKTFDKLSVFGDIYTQSVNSYDLEKLYQDTLLIEGNQTVTGTKVITGAVTFQENVYPDQVNGMILSKDLITLHTDQEIEGPLVFNGDVFVEKNITLGGLLNGLDLEKLANDAVYLDKDQDIEGHYTIHNAVATSDVAVEGTVNGLDLVALDKNVSDFWNEASHALKFMEAHAEDHCEIAEDLQNYLQSSYYILDGFTVHQKLKYPASFVQIPSPTEIALVFMGDVSTNASIVKGTWESSLQKFQWNNLPKFVAAKSVTQKFENIEIDINIGFRNKDSSITINGLPTSVPDGFTKWSLVFLQKNGIVVVALLYPDKGICDTYAIAISVPAFTNTTVMKYGSITVGKEAKSVAAFELSDIPYLAIAKSFAPPYTKGFSQLYAKVNDGWQKVQNIRTSASTEVKHFFYHNYHYLAFTNVAPVYETREAKSVQIYRNTGPNKRVFSLFQKVPFDDAKGLEIFEFGSLSELYLTVWNETLIQVLRMEGESGMRNIVTLHGNCVRDVKSLLINKNIYLVIAQQNLKTDETVTSIIYKGLVKGYPYIPYNFTYCS